MKLISLLLCASLGAVYAQEFDFNLDQLNPEASYLQESVELLLIREQSRADSREMKLNALSNIGAAISRGVTGGEVLTALEYMALEGTVRRTAYRNRLGYPDIRSKAAAYLGELGSPEAHSVLMRMAGAEFETTVLTEIVTSLKKIGMNENQETVQAITVILNHFDALSPDNLLALSGIEAYETFAAQNGWKLDPASMSVIAHIASGRYHGLIRQRARQLLTQLRTYHRNGSGS
ncbi:MAG: HEAT repeat domain-containing protein [Spirochaetaceae bacterium]|jgi:hypothetical protein|nr:HEAT repeat domain-containing protein [Spirochaetaceae bacterium]